MWGDYIFTLEPSGGDRPQMDALESHLTPDGGNCQPTTCGTAVCGTKPNGCGGTLSCGTCASGQTCNASNQCVTTTTTQGPFGGTARSVTTTIQAEDYDVGGETVAYHDTTTGNASAGSRRGSDGVDLEATSDSGGGLNVGWTAAGEWLEYTVNVATTGTYRLDLRTAALDGGKKLHVEVGGVNVSGSVTVPDTNGWQTFTTVSVPNVSLTAGNAQVLRLVFDTDGVNLNWFRFEASSQCVPTTLRGARSLLRHPSNGCGGTFELRQLRVRTSVQRVLPAQRFVHAHHLRGVQRDCGSISNGCGGT